MKKTYLSFAFISVFLGAFLMSSLIQAPKVSAQELSGVFSTSTSTRVPLPQIHVTELHLSTQSYKVGDEISGNFILINNGPYDVSDVAYMAAIVGDYKERLATTLYTKQILGNVALGAGEKKKINFKYILPKNLSGDLGFRMQSIYGGSYKGWEDSIINISGFAFMGEVIRAELSIDGKTFHPETGPSVPVGKDVTLQLSFANKTANDLKFTPHIRIYNTIESNATLQEFDAQEVIVSASGTSEIGISLPTFNYKPGIYAGEVIFPDNSGGIRIPVSTFRYMVLGDMAQILSILSEKTSLSVGESFPVTVVYTGAPFDQFSEVLQEPSKGSLKLEVFDENSVKVAEKIVPVDMDISRNTIQVTLEANKSAKTFVVVATIEKNGVELAKKKTNMSLSAKGIFELPKISEDYPLLWIVPVSSSVFLLLGFVILFLHRNKKNKKHPFSGIPVARSIVGVFLFIVASSWLSFQTLAYKEVTYSGSYNGVPVVCFDVTKPYDLQPMTPGQKFYIEGTQTWCACNNAKDITKDTITIVFEGQTFTYEGPHITNLSKGTIFNTFSYGPLTAPTLPGTYRVYIYESVTAGGAVNWVYSSYGYVDIVVSGSPLGNSNAPVLAATKPDPVFDPVADNYVGAIDLAWTAVPGATGYKLYRDSTDLIYTGSNRTHQDKPLVFNSHHYYDVVGTSPTGNSLYSNVADQYASTYPPPTVSCVRDKATVYVNDSVTWTMTPSGGVKPFTYRWGENSQTIPGETNAWLTRTYPAVGVHNSVLAFASMFGTGQTASVVCPSVSVVVRPPISALTCNATPQVTRIGMPVTWNANVSPSGTYRYKWTGDDGLSGTSQSTSSAYTTLGLKTAIVEVGANGIASSTCTATARVVYSSLQEL